MIGFYTEKVQIMNLGTEIGYPDLRCCSPPWSFQINSAALGPHYTVTMIPPRTV
jgi:hypothetical protein